VQAVWGTPTDEPDEPEIWDGSTEYALMEAVLTSAEGPTPEEMGFDVDYYTAEVI
jgi:hypothetical protein